MKQMRYRVWGKRMDDRERFEKWLMEDRFGMGRCRNGSRAQETAIYLNLERAAKAPFDTDAKVSVLSSLFAPSQPHKSLLVLHALFDMAMEGSEHAREAFEKAAAAWLVDPTLRHLSPRAWCKGTILILKASAQLDSPELKIAIQRAVEKEPDAGVQITFWENAIRAGCDVV